MNVEAVRLLCEKESGKVDNEGNSALINVCDPYLYIYNAEEARK